MKKYVISKTKEPVNIGDVIKKSKRINTPLGYVSIDESYPVTEDVIEELIKEGIVEEVKPSEKNVKEYSAKDVINNLAIKYGTSMQDVSKWLNRTNEICSRAVFDILLKEISFMLYNEDPNAFDEAETYYSVTVTGKVGKVNNIKNNIPLFKSEEDANRAKSILHNQLVYMYGEQN